MNPFWRHVMCGCVHLHALIVASTPSLSTSSSSVSLAGSNVSVRSLGSAPVPVRILPRQSVFEAMPGKVTLLPFTTRGSAPQWLFAESIVMETSTVVALALKANASGDQSVALVCEDKSRIKGGCWQRRTGAAARHSGRGATAECAVVETRGRGRGPGAGQEKGERGEEQRHHGGVGWLASAFELILTFLRCWCHTFCPTESHDPSK